MKECKTLGEPSSDFLPASLLLQVKKMPYCVPLSLYYFLSLKKVYVQTVKAHFDKNHGVTFTVIYRLCRRESLMKICQRFSVILHLSQMSLHGT